MSLLDIYREAAGGSPEHVCYAVMMVAGELVELRCAEHTNTIGPPPILKYVSRPMVTVRGLTL